MELVNTIEINGEEREIADAYSREQIGGLKRERLDNNKNIFNSCSTTLASDLNTIKAATTVSALNEAVQAAITHIQNAFSSVK